MFGYEHTLCQHIQKAYAILLEIPSFVVDKLGPLKKFSLNFLYVFFLSIPEMTHLYSSEIANKNVCVVKIYLVFIDMSLFMIHSTHLANAHFEVTARQLKSFV